MLSARSTSVSAPMLLLLLLLIIIIIITTTTISSALLLCVESGSVDSQMQALPCGGCAVGVESSWNMMAHGDAREGKWRGNWWMDWVASTLHTISEHGVSSITTADTHTSAASSRLNWRPRRFKWTRPFRRKTKSGFCACAITFQTQSTNGTEFCMRNLFETVCIVRARWRCENWWRCCATFHMIYCIERFR